MKAAYILAVLAILLLAGCAKEADMMEEKEMVAPSEPSESESAAPAEPETPVEAEEPVEAPAPEGDIILLGDTSATPGDVTIAAGGQVTFKNEAEKRPHVIIVDELSEKSTRMDIGDTFTFTFEEPGEYSFRDMWVGSLRGTITVE